MQPIHKHQFIHMTEGPDFFPYHEQPKERVTACNLCGSAVFVTVAHRDRYGFPLTVDACRACGLVFLNPRMTREGYAKLYDGPYRKLVSAYHGREINAETIEGEQREYAQRLARILAPHLPIVGHTRRLLDIGGSTGVVAEIVADEFDMDATVLDPCPAEVARARARGLDVRVGTIEQNALNVDAYEVVTMCQTVDHLFDIAKALERVRQHLTSDGIFWVDIVDYGRKPEIKIDHPYYLTPTTMGAYLRKAGFEVKHVEPAPDGVHVGFVCGVGK